MLDKLWKAGRTIVNLCFVLLIIICIGITIKEEISIGTKIFALIIFGGFLWYVISNLKDDWKKEE